MFLRAGGLAWACVLFFSVAYAETDIEIVSPRGGEVYLDGQMQYVRLASTTKFKFIQIDFSRDGGATFLPLGSINNTGDKAKRNLLAFPITGPASLKCVIRATAIQGKTTGRGVSGDFTINVAGAGAIPPMGAAGGDLSGAFPSPQIAAGAVTTAKLADGSVTSAKVTSGAASTGFVLTADGNGAADWLAPAPASSVLNLAGNSIVTALNDAGTTRSSLNASILTGSAAIDISGTAATATLALAVADGSIRLGSLNTSSIDARYVLKFGDTLTGALVLAGNPTLNLHAAPKQYVDAETTRATGAETTLITSVNGKVSKSGDTMTGALVLNADPTLNLHAATKQYVDLAAIGVATGYMILGPTTTPPIGYSYTGSSIVPSANVAWTPKTGMPTPRASLGVAVANNLIFAMGGSTDNNNGSAINESYDPATDTWTTKQPMLGIRTGFVACTVNNKIYAIGGSPDRISGTRLSVNEVYDPVSNSWSSKASMPTARQGSGVAVVNGIIYVIGGSGVISALSTVEAYDPSSNSWSTKMPMPTARYTFGTAVVNNVIYTFGGSGDLTTNEAYDVALNSWSTKAPLPTGRTALVGVSYNNIIYGIGGTKLGSISSTNEAFDPATNLWTPATPMLTPRYDYSAVTLNSFIYAIGGVGAVVLTSNDAFDPSIKYYPRLYLHLKN